MRGSDIRKKRLLAGITGDILVSACPPPFSRTKLSAIERGCVVPKPEELERISAALDRLIAAKNRIDAFATQVGWPTAGAAA